MKKILIIGANGFLGRNLLQVYNTNSEYKKSFSIITSDLTKTNISPKFPFFQLDITDPGKVDEIIEKILPDIIILTAAMTDVDQCEEKKDLARRINFYGPKNIVEACKKFNCKLVFLSTDFVFDGEKTDSLYNEQDIPNPQSYYGLTKFHSELAIIYSEIDYLICRTAVLYGWNETKLNFITWILNNLKNGKKLNIVTNQINSPTYVKNLAEIRYEMALKCAEIFGYDKSLISPIPNLKQKAKRPKNAGLDVKKLKNSLNDTVKIYTIENGLKEMRETRINKNI
ncbi:MAG: SDR family oxidoreductase [Candidatus Lokiarchaeota archaeon]